MSAQSGSTTGSSIGFAEGMTAKREAREFLVERLEAGPVNSEGIIEETKQEGIAKRTLDRAKKDLGVKSRKQGGTGGPWLWELPPKCPSENILNPLNRL